MTCTCGVRFRCQHILFEFILCTEIKILLELCFDGHMFCPEKEDLILFPIKRHWMNCFPFSPSLGTDFWFPTYFRRSLFGSERREQQQHKTKNCDFIFMHNHRIVYSVFWLKPDCIWNCNGVLIFIQSIYRIDSKWIQAWTLHTDEAARPYQVKIYPWKSVV